RIEMIPDSLSPILNHLWQSTLFGGAAWLLTLALRQNSARVRHWVWVAASLKFFVPVSLLIRLGSQVHWRSAPPGPQISLAVALDQVSQPFTTSASRASSGIPVPQRPSRLPMVLWAVWAAGFLGFARSGWIRWRRVKAAVRAGTPLDLG